MSTTDILVDLQTDLVELPESQRFGGIKTHMGMYQSAQLILGKLREKRILEDVREKFPAFEIVCIGHSLGAV
jgi:hypothetical protein